MLLSELKGFPEKKEKCLDEECIPYEFCGCKVDYHNNALTQIGNIKIGIDEKKMNDSIEGTEWFENAEWFVRDVIKNQIIKALSTSDNLIVIKED